MKRYFATQQLEYLEIFLYHFGFRLKGGYFNKGPCEPVISGCISTTGGRERPVEIRFDGLVYVVSWHGDNGWEKIRVKEIVDVSNLIQMGIL